MFSTSMQDKILGKSYLLKLFQHNMSRADWGRRISKNKNLNQQSSNDAEAKLLYSTSVRHLEMTCCFFADQKTRFGPRKIQNPEVDFPSSGQEAESASLKALKVRSVEVWNYKPRVEGPFRYLSTCLASFQCVPKGQCMNWHSLLTQ